MVEDSVSGDGGGDGGGLGGEGDGGGGGDDTVPIEYSQMQSTVAPCELFSSMINKSRAAEVYCRS